MLSRTRCLSGWHYVHPVTGRPLRQTRKFGDPRYINNEAALIKGCWALITADFGMITTTQIENARLAMLRRIPRGSFNLIINTDTLQEYPVIRRAPESRYGGGKNNIQHFAFKLTTGIPLFELMPATDNYRLSQIEAEAIFMPGRIALPITTVVVPQGRVDEYTVFK
jgi:ribosomal protein L16/L10AE